MARYKVTKEQLEKIVENFVMEASIETKKASVKNMIPSQGAEAKKHVKNKMSGDMVDQSEGMPSVTPMKKKLSQAADAKKHMSKAGMKHTNKAKVVKEATEKVKVHRTDEVVDAVMDALSGSKSFMSHNEDYMDGIDKEQLYDLSRKAAPKIMEELGNLGKETGTQIIVEKDGKEFVNVDVLDTLIKENKVKNDFWKKIGLGTFMTGAGSVMASFTIVFEKLIPNATTDPYVDLLLKGGAAVLLVGAALVFKARGKGYTREKEAERLKNITTAYGKKV